MLQRRKPMLNATEPEEGIMITDHQPRRLLRAAILVAATIALGGAALAEAPNALGEPLLDMGVFEACLKNAPNNPDPVEAEEDIAWCCYKAGGDYIDNDRNGDKECVTPPAEGTSGGLGGPIVKPSEVDEPPPTFIPGPIVRPTGPLAPMAG